MNSDDIEAFARRTTEAQVAASEFDALWNAKGLTHLALYDTLAKHIAKGFGDGTWSFEQADTAMNRLWAFLTSRVEGDGWEIPQLFYAVYEAFDAGEYYHREDSRDVNPEEKYTKPLIAEILGQS